MAILILVLVPLLGTGIYYYTGDGTDEDIKSIASMFTGGRLEIELSTRDAPLSWENSAPGQVHNQSITVKNTGSLKVDRLYLREANYTWNGSADLSEVVQVSYFKEYIDGEPVGYLEGGRYEEQQGLGNGDGVLTLSELFAASTSGNPGWDISRDVDLEPGSSYRLEMGFEFLESAGNRYQGCSCSFDWLVMAAQGNEE